MQAIAGRAALTVVLLAVALACFPDLWLGRLRKTRTQGWQPALPAQPAVTSAQLALGATAWAIAVREPVQPAWVALMESSPREWAIYADLHGHQWSGLWELVPEPPRDAGTAVRRLRLVVAEIEEEGRRSRPITDVSLWNRWLDAIEAALASPYDLHDRETNAALLAYIEASGLGRHQAAVELCLAAAAREWGDPAAALENKLLALRGARPGFAPTGRPPWLPAELSQRAAPLHARLNALGARRLQVAWPAAIRALDRREALVTAAWTALAGIAACVAVWLWLLAAWSALRRRTPAHPPHRRPPRNGFARVGVCLALVLLPALMWPSLLSIPVVMLGVVMGIAWNARHRGARVAMTSPAASWGADLRVLAASLGLAAALAVVWVLSLGRAEDEARLALHAAGCALAAGGLGASLTALLFGQPRARGRTRLRAAVVVLLLVAAVLTGVFRLHSSAGAFGLVQGPAVVFFWLAIIALFYWLARQLFPGFAAGALTAHRLVGGAAAVLLVYALVCSSQKASLAALLPALVATVLVLAVVLFEAARARSATEEGERRSALVDTTHAWVCAQGDGLVVLSLAALAFSLVARTLVGIETHQLLTAALLR